MSGEQTADKMEDYKKEPTKQINQSIERTPSKVVNFPCSAEGGEKREKYLTAKYGAHQMAMIRKRLKVEMWMFDQLQIICQDEVTCKYSNQDNLSIFINFRMSQSMMWILI